MASPCLHCPNVHPPLESLSARHCSHSHLPRHDAPLPASARALPQIAMTEAEVVTVHMVSLQQPTVVMRLRVTADLRPLSMRTCDRTIKSKVGCRKNQSCEQTNTTVVIFNVIASKSARFNLVEAKENDTCPLATQFDPCHAGGGCKVVDVK